mmetsp:Transcript_7761/g.23485  ORF Transcript_7761/g.23485 Transcript_7761/m.23485 type:complete len:637 (-) Transcript_7761:65-1975(-)
MLDSAESKVFEVLKRAFRYFGRLLLYFDPHLFWMLDSNFMTPDIYATSWLVTIFARNFSVQAVYALWDLLLLEDNALATYFFAVALILSKREELLHCDESHLPEILMNMGATTVEDVHRLWKMGNELRVAQTPASFQRLMAARLLQPLDNSAFLSAAKSMQDAVTLQTTVEDIMPGGVMQFFTWDCRPESHIKCGKIAQAGVMSLASLRNADELIKASREMEIELELRYAVELCRPLSGNSHICLIGSGNPASDSLDVHPLALRLTQEGIPCVSTLRGGFKEVLKSVLEGNPNNVELVDLDLDAIQKMEAEKRKEAKKKSVASRSRGGERAVPSLEEKSDAQVKEVLNSMLMSRPSEWSASVVLPNADAALFGSAPLYARESSTELTSSSPSAVSPMERDSSVDTTVFSQLSLEDSRFHSEEKLLAPEVGSRSNSDRSVVNPFSESEGSELQPSEPSTRSGNPFVNVSSPSPKSESGPQAVKVTETLEAAKKFWGKAATAGWLRRSSLKYPPEGLRKGFTLNVENSDAMDGIQLFPCRTDPSISKRHSSVIYLGVSRYYVIFSVPHRSSSHLLDVKFLRRLDELRRLSFRKLAPDCMIMDFVPRMEGALYTFTVNITDGRRDAVKLITAFRTANIS